MERTCADLVEGEPSGRRSYENLPPCWKPGAMRPVATGWTARALDQYRAAMQAYWLLIYDTSMESRASRLRPCL